MGLGTIIGILVTGLLVGALARLAVPGPDPMRWWQTLLFGVAGSVLGGGVGYGLGAELGAFVGSVIAATVLILAYRRFVQRRPVTGPGAHLPPP